MAKDKRIEQWLKEDSRFVKVKVGDKYSCIKKGMEFDEEGGFKGKPTVKYQLEDLDDGKIRELSSSSRVLAQKMMKIPDGAEITIIGLLDENDRKTYNVMSNEGEDGDKPIKKDRGEEDEDEDDEDEEPRKKGRIDPRKIPF